MVTYVSGLNCCGMYLQTNSCDVHMLENVWKPKGYFIKACDNTAIYVK